MLTPAFIAQLRLQNQQITRSKFATPEALVAWHGAKQAQDYTHAKWAIGLRLPDATDQTIEQAIDAGTIVRTHIMRPTWHFVSARDIRWMMRLTAPQIVLQCKAREKDLGLDPATFNRTNDLIVRALEGGRQLTRQELAAIIEQAGIMTDSHRMVHIMFRAELDLLVCNGSRRGKEQTYALLEERIPPAPEFSREESLAELARRYFTSHAPATIQDFTWWSGLKVGDARKALEMIQSDLISMPVEGLTYWMPKDLELPDKPQNSVHLLPAFDEFMVSYKERGASLDVAHTAHAITANGIFKPIVVINGRVMGVWSRTEKRTSVLIEHQLLTDVSKREQEGIANAAARFGRFLGKDVMMRFLRSPDYFSTYQQTAIMYKIAIIGSGNVGGALAQQWVKAGHTVLVGAKFPLSEKNIALATKIGEDRFTNVASAVKQCDVVLIATPPTAIFEVMEEMGDVSGKILIDATNAVRQKPEPFATVFHALTEKTKGEVVKCFNTTGFENMLNPHYGQVALDMFMAGSSEKAKSIARQLALDAGFGECWNFGGEDKVALLEQFALSWINLAIMQGHGRDIAFKVIRRP